MTIRTFWLNLGWLVMLVVTVAVPLGLDAAERLTYFTSLTLWKFLDDNGVFLADSFRPDNLHPQAKGYDIWGQEAVRPVGTSATTAWRARRTATGT